MTSSDNVTTASTSDVSEIVGAIRHVAWRSKEEKLKMGIEGILKDYLKRIGVTYEPKYECCIGETDRADVRCTRT